VIFFFVGFNLIVLTTNLILAQYSVAVGNFMLATGAAFVVGKAVLVADAMPFLGRNEQASDKHEDQYTSVLNRIGWSNGARSRPLVEFCMQGDPLRKFPAALGFCCGLAGVQTVVCR